MRQWTVAIDDYELSNLGKLLEIVYFDYDIQRVIVNHYPGSGSGRGNVSRTHEYALFVIPKGVDVLQGKKKEAGERDRGFRRSGTGENNYRTGRPNSFYAILVDPNTFKIMGMEAPPEKENNDYPKEKNQDGYLRVYPIGEDGSERVWGLSYESAIPEWEAGNLVCTENYVIKRLYEDEATREILISLWSSSKFNAASQGTNLLSDILGSSGLFSYPKSVFTISTSIDASVPHKKNPLILDYFAGSGTTGHAVINLNREDGGRRKYILVEMGTYFDTATKPRIQKVIYSKDWKDGKPLSREGSSHCFKYMRLESYEDSLNNLALQCKPDQQLALEQATPAFKESYILSYMLDVESKDSLLSIQSFVHPFDYQMNIATGSAGESKPTPIDLVETFNYLIGLRVETIQAIRDFRVITGQTPEGDRTLIIWRDLEDKSNADLEEFFRKQDYNPRDMEFDLIYVNGDNNLENLRRPDETWKVRLIEEDFLRLMFEEQEKS